MVLELKKPSSAYFYDYFYVYVLNCVRSNTLDQKRKQYEFIILFFLEDFNDSYLPHESLLSIRTNDSSFDSRISCKVDRIFFT